MDATNNANTAAKLVLYRIHGVWRPFTNAPKSRLSLTIITKIAATATATAETVIVAVTAKKRIDLNKACLHPRSANWQLPSILKSC